MPGLRWSDHRARSVSRGTDDEREVIRSLSAHQLTARLLRADRDSPSLIVDDGEIAFEVATEVGSRFQAVDGLTRLAATALALASELQHSRSQARTDSMPSEGP